jgi:hypothetical protein
MATSLHKKYVCLNNYKKLKYLPKLNFKEIKYSKWHPDLKIKAYYYYGYYKRIHYGDTSNLYNNITDICRMNKLKLFKFFELVGKLSIDTYKFCYSMCLMYNSYKICQYIEKVYPPIIHINPFIYFWTFELSSKIYKIIYKNLYNKGLNINNQRSILDLFKYSILNLKNKKRNKLIRFLILKKINKYTKYNNQNPCQLAQVYRKQHRIKFLKKIYIANYCAGKLCYIGGIWA